METTANVSFLTGAYRACHCYFEKAGRYRDDR